MFEPCLDWGVLRQMLAYSIPLLPHNLSTRVASLVSAALINGAGNLSALGLYNVASKFGTVCDTLQGSVSTAYEPWLFRKLKERGEGYKGEIASFTETLIWVYASVFLGIGLFTQEAVLLMLDRQYAEAWMLVPPIVLVYCVKTAYYFYISVLFYYKRAARLIFVATLTGSALNVALSFLLIPPLGAYGSVLADGVSMLVRVSIVVAMSRRYEDVGLRVSRFVSMTLSVALAMAAGLAFSYTACRYSVSLLNLLWKALVFAAFVAAVGLTHRRSAKAALGWVRGRLARLRPAGRKEEQDG